MCESKLFYVRDGREEKKADEVTKITIKDNRLEITSIDKGTFTIDGELSEIDFVGHKITVIG